MDMTDELLNVDTSIYKGFKTKDLCVVWEIHKFKGESESSNHDTWTSISQMIKVKR